LSELYLEWYRSVLPLFDILKQPEKRIKFEQEYKGSTFSPKIRNFLSSGATQSIFYKPNAPVTSLEAVRWQSSFIQCFKEPIEEQGNILATLEPHANGTLSDDDKNSWHKIYRQIIRQFIQRADAIGETNSSMKKGLTYEHLAIILVSAIDGWEVIDQDVRGAAEENDLLISNESSEVFWQNLGSTIIIECKNWGEPLGADGITILDSKMDRLHSHTAILLSKEGVTGDKYRDAVSLIRESRGKHDRYIIILDKNDLIDIANGVHPAEKIRQKYFAILKL
jgi:hypothetical protein